MAEGDQRNRWGERNRKLRKTIMMEISACEDEMEEEWWGIELRPLREVDVGGN